MFTLGGGTKVFLATGATDLRRGFSLYTLIEHQLGCSRPLGGDVYVFTNRRRDLVKLFWFAEVGQFGRGQAVFCVIFSQRTRVVGNNVPRVLSADFRVSRPPPRPSPTLWASRPDKFLPIHRG
jgi:hypothetical protein